MLECKVDSKKLACGVTATGTTKDIMVEICMIINSIYSTMHKQDRLLAEVFRAEMRSVCGDLNSPLWELDAMQGNGLVMTMPIKREEDGNG